MKEVKTAEAVEALRNGKRVAHNCFSEGQFLKLNKWYELIDEAGETVCDLEFMQHSEPNTSWIILEDEKPELDQLEMYQIAESLVRDLKSGELEPGYIIRLFNKGLVKGARAALDMEVPFDAVQLRKVLLDSIKELN